MHEYWSEHPPSIVKEAVSQLEEFTGARRRATAVCDFMKRLGLKLRKAGSVPGKADSEKQRRFVVEAIGPRMSAAQSGEGMVYFMDTSHFVFGVFLGYAVGRYLRRWGFTPLKPARRVYQRDAKAC